MKKFDKEVERRVLNTLAQDSDAFSIYSESKYSNPSHKIRNPRNSKELDMLKQERKRNKYDD